MMFYIQVILGYVNGSTCHQPDIHRKVMRRFVWALVIVRVLAVCIETKAGAFSKPTNHVDETRPNILFLTMDDMNYDSIESYGLNIQGLTPHMDSLASRGILFEYAYVQTPSCTPSRNVFHTGHYSHNSGIQGFFSVDFPQDTLPEALRKNGYYTGIILKVIDSTPTNDTDRYWDYVGTYPTDRARSPESFRASFSQLIEGAKADGKPFYANVNVKDPHLPFYRGKLTKEKFDRTPPSRILKQDEVMIPGFLPQHENFREEVTDYYNTVRRGDDCVGEVLQVLAESGLQKNTLIVFLSDHGMSFPFAKSNLYPNGVRTPWIVVWPNRVKAGTVDSNHLVSAIDLMPTILEATQIPPPGPLAGRSLIPLLAGESQEGWDHVFVEHNEGPGADPRPMRAVHTKEFVYIFNAWATGDYHAIFESRWWRSYATFASLAKTDPTVKKRFDFLMCRTVEELYDVQNDPYAMHNLIEDPAYADVLAELQAKLQTWMEETHDYALEGFKVRNDVEKLGAFMERTVEASKNRSLRLEWKRWQKSFEAAGRPKGKLTELGSANLVHNK
jgi:N-sulfoglucosamine sulfohydrolase